MHNYENENKEISEKPISLNQVKILYHCINLFSNHMKEFLADQLKLWATIEVSLQCLQH